MIGFKATAKCRYRIIFNHETWKDEYATHVLNTTGPVLLRHSKVSICMQIARRIPDVKETRWITTLHTHIFNQYLEPSMAQKSVTDSSNKKHYSRLTLHDGNLSAFTA